MPRFQLHIVKAKNGENVRQPIVEIPEVDLPIGSDPSAYLAARQNAHESTIREAFKLKRGEEIVAITEVNEDALATDYPDGHPFEEPL